MGTAKRKRTGRKMDIERGKRLMEKGKKEGKRKKEKKMNKTQGRCGTKPGRFETPNHFPTSSEVSEQVNE